MSSPDLESIVERIDAVRYVGRYVKLRRVGIQYAGCCPFHEDRTPSFFVHPAKKLWRCWGCGLRGDLYDFVERVDGVGFARAKQILADEAGIVLRNATPSERREAAIRRAAIEAETRDIRYWRRARIAGLEQLKAEALALDDEAELAASARELYQLETSGTAVVIGYRNNLARDSRGARRLIEWSRHDERHAYAVTAMIVGLLAKAQARNHAAT